MRIVQINTFSYKATGNIMLGIHEKLLSEKIDSYVIWGRGRAPKDSSEISIYDSVGIKWHGIYTRLTDRTAFASNNATKMLIEKLNELKPDVIHLHNMHGYFLNVAMLFEYIKTVDVQVVWTLHDCWAFTGHCAYFDAIGCERWKSGCHDCPQTSTYPKSVLMDNSARNYREKKDLFTGVKNMTLVTPSKWLADLAKQSFLSEYEVKVIQNGIDLTMFYPKTSNIREKLGLTNQGIILGVASEWTERKGLKDFIKLADSFGKDGYKIILVGLTKKQLKDLPGNITGIARTANVEELVKLYSAADVFFNPTYEDNFPTTNLEAQACGTPVITYNTGGSPETLIYGCGFVVEKGDLVKVKEILKTELKTSKKASLPVWMDKESMEENYLELYRKNV